MIELVSVMWWVALAYSLLSLGYILAPLFCRSPQLHKHPPDEMGSLPAAAGKVTMDHKIFFKDVASLEAAKEVLIQRYQKRLASFEQAKISESDWRQEKNLLEQEYKRLYQTRQHALSRRGKLG